MWVYMNAKMIQIYLGQCILFYANCSVKLKDREKRRRKQRGRQGVMKGGRDEGKEEELKWREEERMAGNSGNRSYASKITQMC